MRPGALAEPNIRWIVTLATFVAVLLDPPASACASAGPTQDGTKGTVVRRPKVAPIDPSAVDRAATAARALAGSFTARSTPMSAYEGLLGTKAEVSEGTTALPILLRYDRETWNPAASALAKQLAALGTELAPVPIEWRSWGAASKDGAKAVSAFREQLRAMAGPGQVADAIAARKDPLGIWTHFSMYGPGPAVGVPDGQPFVTSTISAFSDVCPLAGAGALKRAPQPDGPDVMVAVLGDVEQGKGKLRCFDIPVAHVTALSQAGNAPLAIKASISDAAGKPVRESVVPLEVARPICAQWLMAEVNGVRRPMLAFLPGALVAGMDGPMRRPERFLEQTWIGVVGVAVDEAEADRAESFEVRVVAGSEVSEARAGRGPFTASTQWAEFRKEAESLSEGGRFHALGMMSLIEWSVASAAPDADLEPMIRGLAMSLEKPISQPRGPGAEPLSEDLVKARALELRIAKWAAKQVRR